MQESEFGDLTLDDLVEELRNRETGKRASQKVALAHISTDKLIEEVRTRQKVIYGPDDRVDLFAVTNLTNVNDSDCVVALFNQADIVNNGDGTSTLQTQNFATARNLCAAEPFGNQPIGAFCSGFLVAPDLIATAGHCVNATNVIQRRFVFGFRMRNATTAVMRINNNEIYNGVALVGRQLNPSTGEDWALVRIDRPVPNHRFARIRRNDAIANNEALHVIGHPSGLPIKFADGANVRDNTAAAFFVANLDTYGGNSGSPVFNANTHEVEGVLVRGEGDFVTTSAGCLVSMVCPNIGCNGEECTRITQFSAQVPVTQWLEPVLHTMFS